MRTTYSFKTHNICPDTGHTLDVLCEITTSDFISVYDLLAEIKNAAAEPVRRPVFTERLGRFCEQHAKSGIIKSTWSDYDGLVSDFEISCQYEWGPSN
jgi:hypothetical protein